MAVGLEGDGLVAPARGQEHAGDTEVDSAATPVMASPRPGSSMGWGSRRRRPAVAAMVAAASRMRPPSNALEKYSALLCP